MAEPFSFPESKLTPPAPRRRVVDRPRLVQALRDGTARRLVAASADRLIVNVCPFADDVVRFVESDSRGHSVPPASANRQAARVRD
jgi:hypothetical protein